MPRIRFGNSWESFDIAPAAGMKALADMNFSFIRVWIFWDDTTSPSPGVIDWTKIDADIKNIRSAGLEVYANLLWAPPHACAGKKTYLPYTRGCSAWNDIRDGSKGIRFATENPFCMQPAHIDADAIREFGTALAARHGSEISWYAAWNEPGGDLYWPSIRFDRRDVAIGRLLDEVTIPFVEGVRSVQPDAKFVGCEADGEGVLDECFQQESDRGLHLFDAVTFHPYSWGKFPDDSYKRIDNEFIPVATRHRNGRPIWYSEVGDDGTGRIVEWTENITSSTRDVSLINYHDYRQWFQPGTWDNNTFVPNEKYEAMKALIAKVNQRRRPFRPASDERISLKGSAVAPEAAPEAAPERDEAVTQLRDWRFDVLRVAPTPE